jgi:protein TonB
MILLAACVALTLSAQQPQLPDAPQPKATPTPFQAPADAPSRHADSAKEPETSKTKPDPDGPESSLVSLEKLSVQDRFIITEFFDQRLRPTVHKHWLELMPEIAKGKRTWYGTVKDGKIGTVNITFKLHKDGSITEIKIEDSSGDQQLDRAALQAVRSSAPMPLPGSFSRELLWMRTTFMYNPKHHP